MPTSNDANPTLDLCLLCRGAYPVAEMWPRPDGFVCKKCQGEERDDAV